ncbi:hypothetical protein HZB58_00800 [Candidatus Gottesmanbacteria bacterium]|nr:hypothetical protein [Candidatus Gottesmanbacteria bacterium]
MVDSKSNKTDVITREMLEDDGYNKFVKVMQTCGDDVTKILKCHLLAEYYLDRLITMLIPKGYILIKSFKYYSEKLSILEAMEAIPSKLVDSLKNLNSVRNDCSHELNYSIDEGDIDKIGRPFGIEYEEIKQENKNDQEVLNQTLMAVIAKLDGVVDATYILKSKKKVANKISHEE